MQARLVWTVALLALGLVPTASAQSPVVVNVDLHVISFGNYDTNKGTYTLDLYLHLSYDADSAPKGFEAARFEFMNGRATSKDLLTDTTDNVTHVRDLWYRIQANLYSEPHFENYPFDRQHLSLQLEDAIRPDTELQYHASLSGSGLDRNVRVAGWRIEGTNATVAANEYPFGETYSRFTYTMDIGREPLSAALRTFLPPLAFMIVSGLSFLLHPSKIGQRITFGTSMLISAVGFHVSQTVSLPTLGRLTLFDQVMLSAYAFLAASLVVTTLIAFNEDFRKGTDKTRLINQRGAALTIALPFIVFLLLRML